MLVIIVGTIGSGKGTFCKGLKEYGFQSYGVGKEVESFIMENLEERGPVDREKLQYWGDAARRKFRQDIWEHRITKKIADNNSVNAIYDSAKYPQEIQRLRNFASEFGDGKSYVLAINAFPWVRCVRLIERGRDGDPKTREEFEIANKRDLYGHRDGDGQNTSECLDLADRMIYNHGTAEDLVGEARKFAREIGISTV